VFQPGEEIERLQAVDPERLEKSSSGVSFSRGTLKCVAARFKMSSSVCSDGFMS